MEIPLDSLYLLNTNQSKAFVIESECKSVGVNRNILNCKLLDSRNIWRNNSRIETPGVNKGIFIPSCDTTSSLRICTVEIEPLDIYVHGSATQERNLDLSYIEKVGVKSVLGQNCC